MHPSYRPSSTTTCSAFDVGRLRKGDMRHLEAAAEAEDGTIRIVGDTGYLVIRDLGYGLTVRKVDAFRAALPAELAERLWPSRSGEDDDEDDDICD